MDIIIPTIAKDVNTTLSNINILFDCLPISRIVIIGDEYVEKIVKNSDKRIVFINEKTIIDIEEVRTWISLYAGDKYVYRSGWYLQQFIKMAYAKISKDDYYLLWDSDTIPLKKIVLFNGNDNPYFDVKKEYNLSYFQTINRLLGLNKQISESFISEHMLINVSIMKELILKIEEQDYSGLKCFGEIIIENAAKSNSFEVGFSEFETYGTYVSCYHPYLYVNRRWKSMRYGAFFYKNALQLDVEDFKWLAKNYDAISFEGKQKVSCFSKIVATNWIKRVLPSTILELMAIFERGKNKIKYSLLCV